jgi:hypothetical protein
MVVLTLLIWASSARKKKIPLLQCLWCSRNIYHPLLQLLRSLLAHTYPTHAFFYDWALYKCLGCGCLWPN